MLKSDKSKVREILQNLLANAIKYTDRGEIELRVFHRLDKQANGHSGGSQGGRISIGVRDRGIGIKESDMSHISEAFYRGEGADRSKHPGTGLGLSIVKQLAELLQGDIQVESE